MALRCLELFGALGAFLTEMSKPRGAYVRYSPTQRCVDKGLLCFPGISTLTLKAHSASE